MEKDLFEKLKEIHEVSEYTNIKRWDKKTLDAVQSKILTWAVLNIGGQEAAKILLAIDKIVEEMKNERLRSDEIKSTYNEEK